MSLEEPLLPLAASDSEEAVELAISENDKLSKTKEEEPTVDRGFFHLYWSFAKPFDYFLLITGFTAAALNGSLMPIQTILLGNIFSGTAGIDKSVLHDNIMDNLGYMILLGVLAFCLSYIQYVCFVVTGARLIRKIKFKYLSSLLTQEVAYFDTVSVGELASVISEQGVMIQAGTSEGLGDALFWISRFISGYFIAFYQNYKVAAAMLLTLPATSGVMAVFMYNLIKRIKATISAMQESGGVAEEILSAIQTVQSFGGEKRAINKYDEKLKTAEKEGVALAKVFGISMGLIYMVIFLSFGVGYWYGSFLIADGQGSFGSVLTPVSACIIGSISIGMATPCGSAIGKAKTAANALFKIIERKTKIDADADGICYSDDKKLSGLVEFKDVSFRYPSRPEMLALRGVSFVIQPGETCALVGPSGTGKSTMISLLERFYDVEAGSVSIDGVDVRKYQLNWIRSQMSLVGQEPILFATSIAENVQFSKPTASMDEIIAACKAANAHNFIMEFPDAYNTQVGERGSQLSGGQKQRIAIARAILRNPSILLLDEATSALDNESEKVVQAAIDDMLKTSQRTTIIIAHRLSTILGADKIVVLGKHADSNGSYVVEEGKHQELLDTGNGAYRTLVESQAKKTDKKREAPSSVTSFFGFGKNSPDLKTADNDYNSLTRRVSSILSKRGSILSLTADLTTGMESEYKKYGTKTKENTGFLSRLFEMTKSEKWLFVAGVIGACIKGGVQPTLSLVMSHLLVKYVIVPIPYLKNQKHTIFPHIFCNADWPCKNPNQICVEYHVPKQFQKIPHGNICVYPCSSNNDCTGYNSSLTCENYADLGILDGKFCSSGFFDGHSPSDVKHTGIESLELYALIGFVAGVGICMQYGAFQTIAFRLSRRLRKLSFYSTVRQSSQFFDEAKHSVGILIADLATNTRLVQPIPGDILGMIFENIFALAVALTIALSSSWKMTAVIFLPMTGLVYTEYYQHHKAREIAVRQVQGDKEAGKLVAEALRGVKTVYSFSATKRLANMYDKELEGPESDGIRSSHVYGLGAGIAQACFFAAYAFGLWWGGVLIEKDELDSRDFSRVLFVLTLTATFLGQSAARCGEWSKAGVAANSIFSLADARPEIDPYSEAGNKLKSLKGEIEFKNLTFYYPARPDVPVLNHLNLKIKAGQTCAFVGSSGCGKSSLIRLIERFYDVQVPGSSITVDGHDIRTLNLKWWRSQIGLVGQEPVLFEGSIAENIMYGKEGDVTLDEVKAAAKSANAHDFIMEFPEGYRTNCGGKGSQLSGGQKQRIAIARALIKDPKILLLDEATSALDNESERVVQKALDKIVKDGKRTIIIIAHRLSTVVNSDNIVVFHNDGSGGDIVEQGTHDELMAIPDGRYKELHKRRDEN